MGDSLLVGRGAGRVSSCSTGSWAPTIGPDRSSAGNGQTYEFRFRGDAEAASELLARLVQQGVRISGFARRRDNLEDLFLKVGSKELS